MLFIFNYVFFGFFSFNFILTNWNENDIVNLPENGVLKPSGGAPNPDDGWLYEYPCGLAVANAIHDKIINTFIFAIYLLLFFSFFQLGFSFLFIQIEYSDSLHNQTENQMFTFWSKNQ